MRRSLPLGPCSGRAAPAAAVVAVAAAVALAAVVVFVRAVGLPPAGAATSAATVTIRTVIGPGQLESPGGLALDTAGDLFVADTGHCRVLELPAHPVTRNGKRLPAGHLATVAGGSCTGAGTIGHPTAVAVDAHGDLFVAEATGQRVQEVRPGSTAAVTVAGTGQAGFNGNGLPGTDSELDQPTSVAVDAGGDLFIADTANCIVRVLPASDTTLFGQAVTAGELFTVAGTGVCGSTGQGGPAHDAQVWNPVAVAVDPAGDVLVADAGDQSVLLAAVRAGTYYGTAVGAGDLGVVVGGTGSYGPYLADGLSATGPAAELNDPRGLAVAPDGALFVTDGFMHSVRVVPSANATLLGRAMKGGDLYTAAGAVPVTNASGTGDGTRWVDPHVDTPSGVVVSATGILYVADATSDEVLAIASGGRAP